MFKSFVLGLLPLMCFCFSFIILQEGYYRKVLITRLRVQLRKYDVLARLAATKEGVGNENS